MTDHKWNPTASALCSCGESPNGYSLPTDSAQWMKWEVWHREHTATSAERENLPWYHPIALPRFEGDATHCRDPKCPSTNWGGSDRVHLRDSECPPLVARIENGGTDD